MADDNAFALLMEFFGCDFPRNETGELCCVGLLSCSVVEPCLCRNLILVGEGVQSSPACRAQL